MEATRGLVCEMIFPYSLHFLWYCYSSMSWDSSVGIAPGYGVDDRMIGVLFPAGAGNFSLLHCVQSGPAAHPVSYPMGTRGSFPGGKAAGAWSWPHTSIWCRGQRMSGDIPPLPQYVPVAWCLLKHRENFTFTLTVLLLGLFVFPEQVKTMKCYACKHRLCRISSQRGGTRKTRKSESKVVHVLLLSWAPPQESVLGE
jgi:hypothetical protein